MSIIRDDRRARQEFAALHTVIPPVHPGVHLLEDFLEPLGISQSQLASDLGITPRRVNEIIKGKRAVTAETALLLAEYFQGVGAQYWMDLQSRYDLERTRDAMAPQLQRVRPMPARSA
jgi:addiction module HigA family antidote